MSQIIPTKKFRVTLVSNVDGKSFEHDFEAYDFYEASWLATFIAYEFNAKQSKLTEQPLTYE